MQTINIVVADFAGRDRSEFIDTINTLYAETSQDKFAKIRIAPDTRDEVQLCFFLVPSSIDDHTEAEAMWEFAIEGASAFIFGIPGSDPQAYAEAAQLIHQFRAYRDLPLIVVAYDADHLHEDTIQRALHHPEHCRITYFAPEQMAIEVIVRDVVIAIIHHATA